jgi:hypothetical protein
VVSIFGILNIPLGRCVGCIGPWGIGTGILIVLGRHLPPREREGTGGAQRCLITRPPGRPSNGAKDKIYVKRKDNRSEWNELVRRRWKGKWEVG